MKTVSKLLSILLILILTVCISTAGANPPVLWPKPAKHQDRTLSPYFFVKSDDPSTDQLPLKSTSADVNISGVIADVTVTQIYKNEGKNPIEAVYIFPASTRAAVYGLKMTIGERVINAEIRKRDEARQQYEQAKNQGKSASLLEQHRPNVFQMNVANIMPGDAIEVQLKYNELLVPEDRIYEFVYPTVVGPRYANQPVDSSSDKWVQNPYLHEGELPDYRFNINVNITAGMPIQKIHSTSHRVDVNFKGTSDASIVLDSSERQGGNRDFILKYGLAGNAVTTGLLLYEGEKENFFLLMMQPPERAAVSDIPGREYIFIVDISGSMHGFPLDISKKLLKDLIGQLRPSDMFNVLLFAGGSSVMSERSLPATRANIQKAINLIDYQHGGGGTEILPALKRALALPCNEDYSRTIVIATDGYVRVEEQAFDLIRNNLGNANMFAFGIGSSVNRHIIEGMAHVGMGEPFIITHPEKALAEAARFRKIIQFPVLTNVAVDFGNLDTYSVEPLSIPDVMAERPVIVFGKWRGQPKGKITISGIAGRKDWKDSIDIGKVKPSERNSALRYLWARDRIRILSDYNMLSPDDERIQEVTSLGLTYNLLTAYTSFVAIDSEVRNKGGKTTTVTQPLPLPKGVSDHAVGSMLKSAPAKYGRVRNNGLAVPHAEPKIAEEAFKDDREKDRADDQIKNISVSNGLTEEDVSKVTQNYLKEIQSCHINKSHSVTLNVTLTVDAGGNVKNIKITGGSFKNDSLDKCIEKKIRKWQFPKIRTGSKATVSFSLILT